MSERKIDLAKRAIACKDWEWIPGMKDTDGYIFIGYDLDGEGCWVKPGDDGLTWFYMEGRLPDFSDPVTLQCMVLLIRKAWNNPYAHVEPWPGNDETKTFWGAWPSGSIFIDSDYEDEALVKALEAAP